MQKSFSLIEIIVVILIITIISSFAISKIYSSIYSSNIVKIKSEISLIRTAIEKQHSQQVLLGLEDSYITYLDDAKIDTLDETIFNGYEELILLDYLILSTNRDKKEFAKWIKIDDNKYQVFLKSDESVTFIYDNSDGSFDCTSNNQLCKELNQ